MSQLIDIFDTVNPGRRQIFFWCPGCKENHSVHIGSGSPSWQWNGSKTAPTFRPSVRVRWGSQPGAKTCHFYVKEGTIQYLGDCTHELKGKTVDMIPAPDPADG